MKCLLEGFTLVMQNKTVTVFVAVVVPEVLPVMHVFVIYVAVSAHQVVVPVGVAVPALNAATALELMGLETLWIGNIQLIFY